jgi:hypothetical protein
MENEVKTNPDEPIHTIEYNNNYISNGLTKREYFAAMALQALLEDNTIERKYCVQSAVDYADALIEELSKTNNNGKKL